MITRPRSSTSSFDEETLSRKLSNVEERDYERSQEYLLNHRDLYYGKARAYRSLDLAVNDSVDTVVAFNAESFDCQGVHAAGRFTVPPDQGGFYWVSATVQFEAHATGVRRLRVFKNGGGTASAEFQLPQVAAAVCSVMISTVLELRQGDYVEFKAWQTSGGALNILAGEQLSFGQLVRW